MLLTPSKLKTAAKTAKDDSAHVNVDVSRLQLTLKAPGAGCTGLQYERAGHRSHL